MKTIRAEFSKATKEQAWERCKERCEGECKQPFDGRTPEYDHDTPAALGGDNSLSNCVVLCPKCHSLKTKLEDLPRIVKAKSIEEKRAGLRRTKQKIRSRGFERWTA